MVTRRDARPTRHPAGDPVAAEPVAIWRAGTVPYRVALQQQRDRAEAIRRGEAPETVIVVEHPPVFTLGRRAKPEHVLLSAPELAARQTELVEVERGGDVTFHGPGQLVVYPLLRLGARGIGPAAYVRALEAAMIRVLRHPAVASTPIRAQRSPGRPGVWVPSREAQHGDIQNSDTQHRDKPSRKIGAVGVRVQRGVSLHGLALNVAPDLRWFEAIVPCGLPDVDVTSIERELGGRPAPTLAVVAERLLSELAAVLDLRLADAPLDGAAPVSSTQ